MSPEADGLLRRKDAACVGHEGKAVVVVVAAECVHLYAHNTHTSMWENSHLITILYRSCELEWTRYLGTEIKTQTHAHARSPTSGLRASHSIIKLAPVLEYNRRRERDCV